jgi:hypothetical protein
MRFRKLEILTAAMVVTAAVLSVHAEENVIPALPKDEKQFFEKTQRLNSLTTRIEEAEKQFQELVRRKAAEKDNAEKDRIIKQMNEVTKDRNKSADEYNKVKSDLDLRYPNEGKQLNRRYQTQTKKSVEEMEGVAGLDELLTRTKKVVEKKFAPFAAAEDEKKPKAKIAKPEDEKPQRLRLEK